MQERPNAPMGEHAQEPLATQDQGAVEEATAAGAEGTVEEAGTGTMANDRLNAELDALRAEHAALHDKFVRLHADFDNFRKRTAKDRLDLLQSAAADTLRSILPVLDDMERAKAHNAEVEDIGAVKEGFELIHQKFVNILAAQGLKVMPAMGAAFDPDLHEAVSQVAAPEAALKGKVVAVVENGYTLNDKVVRYAKVVVGQ